MIKNWNGSKSNDIDRIIIEKVDHVTSGRYGGSSQSGAYKNEDGYIILKEDTYVFSVLFDAHTSNDSVLLVSQVLTSHMDEIKAICSSDQNEFSSLQSKILDLLMSPDMTNHAKTLKGETAILFCLQKDDYLWWLSIGDNSLYLYHEEYKALGQYRLNQRVFYQWFGKANSLGLKRPCYSSGSIQLRLGLNKIVMLTDGVLEIDQRPFEDNEYLYKAFENNNEVALENILGQVSRY